MWVNKYPNSSFNEDLKLLGLDSAWKITKQNVKKSFK